MSNKKSGLLAVGALGMVVGAVGSLVGIFLSDEKNRAKVVKEARVLKNAGEKKLKVLRKKVRG